MSNAGPTVETQYIRDLERALRRETSRRVTAEKIVGIQSTALDGAANFLQGDSKLADELLRPLRTIIRECGGCWTSLWRVPIGDESLLARTADYHASEESRDRIDKLLDPRGTTGLATARFFLKVVCENNATALLEIDDPRLPVRLRRVLADLGVARIVVSPVRCGDQVLGWIAFYSATKRVFREVVAVIEVAARRTALAIRLAEIRRSESQATLTRERERMARDMHDLLAQTFSGIMLQVDACLVETPTLTSPPVQRLERIRTQAENGLTDIHRLLQMLSPSALGDATLPVALRALAAEIGACRGLACHFAERGSLPRLDGRETLHLFAIATEAVRNAVKHAAAGRINIRLSGMRSGTVLAIFDDGRGLPAHETAAGRGLNNMRERAGDLSARIAIRTRARTGTCIRITLPAG